MAQNPPDPPPSPAEPHGSITSIEARFEGPLPPPLILRQYDEVLPGAADRIMTAFERETLHRHNLQAAALQAQIADEAASRREARWGQVFGFAIGTIAIISGAVTAMRGAELAGGFIGTGGVVALVTAFIVGRTMNGQEQKNRQ